MSGIRFLFVLALLWGCTHAQNDTLALKQLSARSLGKMGKNALKQGDPNSAILYYSYAIQKKNLVPAFYFGLGMAYLQVRDYRRAQRAFYQSYQLEKKDKKGRRPKTPALYYCALMQKSSNQHDSAKLNFTVFKKEYKGNDKLLKRQATKEIAFSDSLQKLLSQTRQVSVFRLDTSVNKVNTESSPLLIDDHTLVYSSVRTERQEIVSDEDTGRSITRKLYYASKKNGKWKFVGEYGELLNENDANTGNACLSGDKKRLYFTRCKQNSRGQMICAIYVSCREGDAWTEPVKLPKTVNHPKYTSSMPAVYTDELKGHDIIYFVSNRKKGRGGFDIWYTVYNKKTNTYREPKNAGSKINSSQNELSPYFDKETQSLYFSSEGWGGFGGYDVYRASGDGKRWSSTENIGKPINTGADELYYTISENRREGFFVSNRAGGNSLKNATCCDDIYAYFDNDYKRSVISGQITENDDPFEPLANVRLDVFLKTPGSDERVFLKTVYTDSKGKYKVDLEPAQDYVLLAKKQNYLSEPASISTRSVAENSNQTTDLKMRKKSKDVITLPHLQYEFASAKLLRGSETLLDTTILRLMNDNPEIIIEIQSHTDSKGGDDFNLRLSQKRAESVVNYLVKKGVNPKRLQARGYGETKPIAPNQNADGTDNPEGRALNRRTDFRIIGEIDAEILPEKR